MGALQVRRGGGLEGGYADVYSGSLARTLAWDREPVKGVERGDHDHAQDGQHGAKQAPVASQASAS